MTTPSHGTAPLGVTRCRTRARDPALAREPKLGVGSLGAIFAGVICFAVASITPMVLYEGTSPTGTTDLRSTEDARLLTASAINRGVG